MTSSVSLINELEDALQSGSPEKRLATLRRVTSLFLNEADRLNEEQIAIFDDVLVHLVQTIEVRARAELSNILAPLDNAPIEVVRRLAHDDEIAVASPVLTRSTRLTETDLVEIAKNKSQGHLQAISGRATLSEGLTDVLIERGNREVVHTLAANSGARFSEFGYNSITVKAIQDGPLAEKLAVRVDVPLPLLRQLLARATDVVRDRLLDFASMEKRDYIHRALISISDEVGREVSAPRDFSASERLVQRLENNGTLNEQALATFARERRHEDMASALASLCGAPVEFIERLLQNVHAFGLITACKSIKLSWSTVLAILEARFSGHTIPEEELTEARTSFLVLSHGSAQRTLRFMLAQEKIKKSQLAGVAAVAGLSKANSEAH